MSWYEGPYQYIQGPGGFGLGFAVEPPDEEEEDRRRRGRDEPYEYWGGARDAGYGPMRPRRAARRGRGTGPAAR